MTEGDLWPDPRNAPATLRKAVQMGLRGEVPRRRLARSVVRNALRRGPLSGNEPELPAGIDTLATLLRERGYHVAIKGKWHVSKPVGPTAGAREAPGAHRARLRLQRLGAAGHGRHHEGRGFRRGVGGRERPGLGRGLHEADGELARAPGSAGAVLPDLLAGEPARRARLSQLLPGGRIRSRTPSAISGFRSRRRSTRTCARSRRCRRSPSWGWTTTSVP